MQVCTSDADVKRALRAWEAYSTTGQQATEAYTQGLPRKHTLQGLWASAGKGSAEVGQQAGQQQKRAKLGDGAAAAAGSTWLTDARRLNKAESGAAACSGAGQEAHASMNGRHCPAATPAAVAYHGAEPVQPAAQKGQGSPERKDAIDLITPEASPAREQLPCEPSTSGRPPPGSSARASTGNGAGKNAFSMLMQAAKSPPKQAPSSGREALAAARGSAWGNEWRDVLRQVAMHPGRQAPTVPWSTAMHAPKPA